MELVKEIELNLFVIFSQLIHEFNWVEPLLLLCIELVSPVQVVAHEILVS